MMHIRAIVTESAGVIRLARLIHAPCPQQAERMTRHCLLDVLQSLPGVDPPDPDEILKHGGAFFETAEGPVSVLILTPCVAVSPAAGTTGIDIRIERGCVTQISSPVHIRVTVRDYDTDGADESQLMIDERGKYYLPTVWEHDATQSPSHELGNITHHLRDGFLVITDTGVKAACDAFEAWAYAGPLDFNLAQPVCFGLGPSPAGALSALDYQLSQTPRPIRKA